MTDNDEFLMFFLERCNRLRLIHSLHIMCTREDALAHYLGALSLNDVKSHNELTTAINFFFRKISTSEVLDEAERFCRRTISICSQTPSGKTQ